MELPDSSMARLREMLLLSIFLLVLGSQECHASSDPGCKPWFSDRVANCSERPLNFGIKENLTATSCYYLHTYSGTGNYLNSVRMHTRYHSPPVVTEYILIHLQSAAKIFGFAIKLMSTPAHSFFIDYGYSKTTNLNNPVERSNRMKYFENNSPAMFHVTSGYQKFYFKHPFIAKNVYVLPVDGSSSFQLELYGCFLGASFTLTGSAALNTTKKLRIARSHYSKTALNISRFFVTLKYRTRPNIVVVEEVRCDWWNANLTVPGLADSALWVPYQNGYLLISKMNFFVQDRIKNPSIVPHTGTKLLRGEKRWFRVSASNPKQRMYTDWNFGDGASPSFSWTSDYYYSFDEIAIHHVTATLRNDIHAIAVSTTVVVCYTSPFTLISNTIFGTDETPGSKSEFVFKAKMVLDYLKININNITVRFNGTFLTRILVYQPNYLGIDHRLSVYLPTMELGSFPLELEYTDNCTAPALWRKTIEVIHSVKGPVIWIFLDQENVTRLTNGYKIWSNQLYYVKVNTTQGHENASCQLVLERSSLRKSIPLTKGIGNEFTGQFIRTPEGVDAVTTTCSNAASSADSASVNLISTDMPVALSNVSTFCLPDIAATNTNVQLMLRLQAGTKFECDVVFSPIRSIFNLTYGNFSTTRKVVGSFKTYVLMNIKFDAGGAYSYDVQCSNMHGSIRANGKLIVEVPVSGLSISEPIQTICRNETLMMSWSAVTGSPLNVIITLRGITLLSTSHRNATGGNFTLAGKYLQNFLLNKINVTIFNNVSTISATKTAYVLPSWKSLTFNTSIEILMRPLETSPAQANISFGISTDVSQSLSHVVWVINNDVIQSSSASEFNYVFTSVGAYSISATVVGCWNETFTRYLVIGANMSSNQFPILKPFSACFSCLGAEAQLSRSYVAYGSNNCSDSMKRGADKRACPSYNLTSTSVLFNISDIATYEALRTGENAYHVTTKSRQVSMQIKDCLWPEIQPKGLLLMATNSSVNITRSQQLNLQLDIIWKCPIKHHRTFTWQIFYTGKSRKSVNRTQAQPISLIKTDSPRLEILPYTLHSGFHMVTFIVRLSGPNQQVPNEMARDFYLNVTSRYPVAIIANGPDATAVFPNEYILDGSGSRDPDQPISSPISMIYTWICRDPSSPLIDLTDDSVIEKLPIIDYNNVPVNSSGCFGKSQGILSKGSSKRLVIPTLKMTENVTYEMILVVSKSDIYGRKSSHFIQRLYIDMALRPILHIKCIDNCQRKVNANWRISLEGSCTGGGCDKPILLAWNLYKITSNTKTLVPLQEHQTPAGNGLFNYIVKADVLEPRENYTIVFGASKGPGINAETGYSFQVNDITVEGNCSAYPSQGVSLVTYFNIHCSGWYDDDGPLRYTFLAVSRHFSTTLCNSLNQTCIAELPVDQEAGFITRVEIIVSDQLGATVKLERFFKVTVPTLSSLMMENVLKYTGNSTSQSSNSSKEVIIQKLSALSNLLNILSQESVNGGNATNDITSMKRINFRKEAVSHLLALDLPAAEKLNTISPIAASLCSHPKEVSGSSANDITHVLANIERTLEADFDTMQYEELIRCSKNYLMAAAAVVKTCSVNGIDVRRNTTTITKDWHVSHARKNNLQLTNSTHHLLLRLVSRLVPGEEPLIINSSSLKALVARKLLDDDHGNISATEIGNCQVSLPKNGSLGFLVKKDHLDVLMSVYDFNPFFWSNSSNSVKTDVLDFTLAGNQISNSSEDIDLIIRRPNKTEPPWTSHYFRRTNEPNYHRIDLAKHQSIHLELMPFNSCLSYDVYMKHKSRPTAQNHDWKWSVPDFSNCSYGSKETACTIYNNITRHITRNMTSNQTSCFQEESFIRDHVINTTKCSGDRNPFRIFVSNAELRPGTYFIAVTPQDTENRVQPTEARDNCTLNNSPLDGYHMLVYTANCLYWNAYEEWINKGCKVGPRTTWQRIHCQCNHLTSFASDFLVAPNPIDMSKVMAGFKNLSDNLSVLIFLCFLIAFYLLLVVVLRRRDRADLKKLGVSLVPPFFPAHRYLIVFSTGARPGAGTTANVCVFLIGDQRKSEPRILRDPVRTVFQRDQINAFEVSYSKPIGTLKSVVVWHDNSGSDPSWFISHIYVEDLQTGQRCKFLCMRWLAVDKQDGKIESVFSISDEHDFSGFSHLFTSKVARKCSDEHIWLSVALNRAHSTFTRVRRLTCCLCLLAATMLTSAMFFSFDGASSSGRFVLRVGSLSIDFRGVVIGVQSGIIAIPVNAVILYLFRNTKRYNDVATSSKRNMCDERDMLSTNDIADCEKVEANTEADIEKNSGSKSLPDDETPVFHISLKHGDNKEINLIKLDNDNDEESPKSQMAAMKMNGNSSSAQGKIQTGVNQEIQTSNSKSKANQNRVQKFRLCVAWFLSFIVVAGSFTVILFYSMMWGNSKSQQWLLSVLTGFFQSMFVVQPLKLLVFSMLAAAIFKVPEKEEDVLDAYKFAARYSDEEEDEVKNIPEIDWNSVRRLSEKQRIEARSLRLKKARLYRLCRDVSLYVLFLVFLSFTVRGYRDPASYSLAQASGITGSAFQSIKDADSAWFWIRDELIPGLYDDEWYNGKSTNSKLLPDKASYLVGPARLRQIRIKPGTCKFAKEYVHSSDYQTCNDYFSLGDEDTTKYSESWQPSSVPSRTRRQVTDISQHSSLLKDRPSQIIYSRQRRYLRLRKVDFEILSDDVNGKTSTPVNITELIAQNKLTTEIENWEHQSMSELNGFPYIGHFAVYSGGGYATSLDSSFDTANIISIGLQYYEWVDHLTRAVFAEFSIYNANSNLFGTAFILVEFLPHGGAVPFGFVNVFNLYRYNGPNGKLIIASEVLVVLLLFFFIYRDMRRLYQQGWIYFREFWNIVDAVVTVLVFTALILWFSRWYQGDRNMMRLRMNPASYVSFQYTAAADEAMVTCFGLIVFFSVLKLLQYIQFHPMILQLSCSLKQSARPVASFILPFAVTFVAFGGLGYTAFGSSLETYTSFLSTIETQFLMTLGGSNFHALRECDPVLGPLYFILFVLFQVFFIFNLLIAALNESIEAEYDNSAEDQEFIRFMMQTFTETISHILPKNTINSKEDGSANRESIQNKVESLNLRDVTVEVLTEFDSKIEDLDDKVSSLEQQTEDDFTMMDVILKLMMESACIEGKKSAK